MEDSLVNHEIFLGPPNQGQMPQMGMPQQPSTSQPPQAFNSLPPSSIPQQPPPQQLPPTGTVPTQPAAPGMAMPMAMPGLPPNQNIPSALPAHPVLSAPNISISSTNTVMQTPSSSAISAMPPPQAIINPGIPQYQSIIPQPNQPAQQPQPKSESQPVGELISFD